MPNSWVPKLPGVTHSPLPTPLARRSDWSEGVMVWGLGDQVPRKPLLPRLIQLGPPRHPSPNVVFSVSPPPGFPRSFSVSQSRCPCVIVPSDSSVHTRTERACSSHFPEFNSRPLREGTRARISNPRSWPESGGLRAASVRAPIPARARTHPWPASAPIAFLLDLTTPQRGPSHRPRACRRCSACARPFARRPASRAVGKGSEQRSLRRAGGGGDGDLGGGGGGGGYDGDGCARSLGVMAAAGSR